MYRVCRRLAICIMLSWTSVKFKARLCGLFWLAWAAAKLRTSLCGVGEGACWQRAEFCGLKGALLALGTENAWVYRVVAQPHFMLHHRIPTWSQC